MWLVQVSLFMSETFAGLNIDLSMKKNTLNYATWVRTKVAAVISFCVGVSLEVKRATLKMARVLVEIMIRRLRPPAAAVSWGAVLMDDGGGDGDEDTACDDDEDDDDDDDDPLLTHRNRGLPSPRWQLILCGLAFLRFGSLMRFLSPSVLTGFVTGSGVYIFLSQSKVSGRPQPPPLVLEVYMMPCLSVGSCPPPQARRLVVRDEGKESPVGLTCD
jgi:hypothetical protein